MPNQELILKLQSRQGQSLAHGSTHSMQADCPHCGERPTCRAVAWAYEFDFCFALWCAPCASYLLRRHALHNDMSRYTCCAGYSLCSDKCGERSCPAMCLCAEVWCCFANSVQSTRFLLQDEFNIQTTKCDDCILCFKVWLRKLACIFSIVASLVGGDEFETASNILDCAADVVYSTVGGCMQTQHKVELEKRDGMFGREAMRAPQPAAMSRLDQPTPPPVGYRQQHPNQAPYPVYGPPPSAPVYGQPYGAPAPGYPPQGYPHGGCH